MTEQAEHRWGDDEAYALAVGMTAVLGEVGGGNAMGSRRDGARQRKTQRACRWQTVASSVSFVDLVDFVFRRFVFLLIYGVSSWFCSGSFRKSAGSETLPLWISQQGHDRRKDTQKDRSARMQCATTSTLLHHNGCTAALQADSTVDKPSKAGNYPDSREASTRLTRPRRRGSCNVEISRQ